MTMIATLLPCISHEFSKEHIVFPYPPFDSRIIYTVRKSSEIDALFLSTSEKLFETSE